MLALLVVRSDFSFLLAGLQTVQKNLEVHRFALTEEIAEVHKRLDAVASMHSQEEPKHLVESAETRTTFFETEIMCQPNFSRLSSTAAVN